MVPVGVDDDDDDDDDDEEEDEEEDDDDDEDDDGPKESITIVERAAGECDDCDDCDDCDADCSAREVNDWPCRTGRIAVAVGAPANGDVCDEDETSSTTPGDPIGDNCDNCGAGTDKLFCSADGEDRGKEGD